MILTASQLSDNQIRASNLHLFCYVPYLRMQIGGFNEEVTA